MTDKLHFDDLTKITCPASMLDDDTLQRLMEWPHGRESWDYILRSWVGTYSHPHPKSNAVYRAKPAPVVRKMSPPWDVIDTRFNWAAMDEDGEVFFYDQEPRLFARQWAVADDGDDLECANFLTFDRGNAPWHQSLVVRPGHGEGAA